MRRRSASVGDAPRCRYISKTRQARRAGAQRLRSGLLGLSLVLGLAGALVGYVNFTLGLGIGDTDIFDWGGLLGAIIGTLIVLGLAGYFLRRRQPGPPPRGTAAGPGAAARRVIPLPRARLPPRYAARIDRATMQARSGRQRPEVSPARAEPTPANPDPPNEGG
jgi:uncharacterized membrane protein YeaQ/YmgE (transglycosylase-associated protein family)